MSSVVKALFELLVQLPEFLFRLFVDIFRLLGLLIEITWDQLLFIWAEAVYGDMQFAALAALAIALYICWRVADAVRLWLAVIIFLPIYFMLFWCVAFLVTSIGS